MSTRSRIEVGGARLNIPANEVSGTLRAIDGSEFYCINQYDRIRPFLMTVVSAYDHWMFISSNGALTAGRGNADQAIFPYTTDDKIHDAAESTGSKTLFLIMREDRSVLWEPFSIRYEGLYTTSRRLYKRLTSVAFEEENVDLGLIFRYSWAASDAHGFVRRCTITNSSDRPLSLEVLDGIQNVLPSGVSELLTVRRSTLVDAYKMAELEGTLGIYSLSSLIVDRPEPSEALRATTVWGTGLDTDCLLLSSRQLSSFRRGQPLRPEHEVRAERGAYFMNARLDLQPGESRNWLMAADVLQGPAEVAHTRNMLRNRAALVASLTKDIADADDALQRLIASSDGFQRTNDRTNDARHASNTLFNVMRGGLFRDQYTVRKQSFRTYVQKRNALLFERESVAIDALPETLTYQALCAADWGAHMRRIVLEYLPLSFSRRHGDPSRPWNRFSIRKSGMSFEGNWRDIFQNWEALARSCPQYLPGMIATFVSASTPDGYNPYRITHQGVEWEVPDPSDPWAHIGYWGDHQAAYLIKLLELARSHDEDTLLALLHERCFAFANVPYRIRSFDDIVRDPHHSIDFDSVLDRTIRDRVQRIGWDGKLVQDDDGEIALVTLAEKLLLVLLVRLTNLVPGVGIWMNTQRPEWNDANNALAGRGVSTVTLCFLHRFTAFVAALPSSSSFELSEATASYLDATLLALSDTDPESAAEPCRRQILMERLGLAGDAYRRQVYGPKFIGSRTSVDGNTVQALCCHTLAFTAHAIGQARRPDGLYHAYSVLDYRPGNRAAIRTLQPMLEGQVAVLSSGVLTAEEAVALATALRSSTLYRQDQHSYLLYPDRTLPRFVQRNVVPEEIIASSLLLRSMLDSGASQLVGRRRDGRYYFNPDFRNAADVQEALDALATNGRLHVSSEEAAYVLEAYEQVFNHSTFTGRSGSFFKYEGLGCIYWHMVSKLLLALNESFHRAVAEDASARTIQRLATLYYEVRSGIGQDKSVAEYGAVCTEPYSHTPGHTGAQQPGLTGQVKEDILSRWGELGVVIRSGTVSFTGALLRHDEFLDCRAQYTYINVHGNSHTITLHAGELAFTYCQVPIVYHNQADEYVQVISSDGSRRMQGMELDAASCSDLFNRTGRITRVDVAIRPAA